MDLFHGCMHIYAASFFVIIHPMRRLCALYQLLPELIEPIQMGTFLFVAYGFGSHECYGRNHWPQAVSKQCQSSVKSAKWINKRLDSTSTSTTSIAPARYRTTSEVASLIPRYTLLNTLPFRLFFILSHFPQATKSTAILSTQANPHLLSSHRQSLFQSSSALQTHHGRQLVPFGSGIPCQACPSSANEL